MRMRMKENGQSRGDVRFTPDLPGFAGFLLTGDIRPRKRRLELRNLLSGNAQFRPQICGLFRRLGPGESKGRFGSMRDTQRDESRGLTELACVHLFLYICIYKGKREAEIERKKEGDEYCLDSQSKVAQNFFEYIYIYM